MIYIDLEAYIIFYSQYDSLFSQFFSFEQLTTGVGRCIDGCHVYADLHQGIVRFDCGSKRQGEASLKPGDSNTEALTSPAYKWHSPTDDECQRKQPDAQESSE